MAVGTALKDKFRIFEHKSIKFRGFEKKHWVCDDFPPRIEQK